jgi:hypothetical protein
MKLRLAIWADIRCAIQSAIQFTMFNAMLRAMPYGLMRQTFTLLPAA